MQTNKTLCWWGVFDNITRENVKATRKSLCDYQEKQRWYKISLTDLLKELYEKINKRGVTTKPQWYEEGYLGKIGRLLSQSDVIQTLMRYYLHIPNYDKYQVEKNKR